MDMKTKNLRILSRVVVINNNKILIVRNKNCDFWYLPGGGWEYEKESVIKCAIREVQEETGYLVKIKKLIASQELHDLDGSVFFENFWLAEIDQKNTKELTESVIHKDLDPDGEIDEIKWQNIKQLKDLKFYPKALKNIEDFIKQKDYFLGVF